MIPTSTQINQYLAPDNLNIPDFSVGNHGRYRINGGAWVDYVAVAGSTGASTDFKEAFDVFLNSITVDNIKFTDTDSTVYALDDVKVIDTYNQGSTLKNADDTSFGVDFLDIPISFYIDSKRVMHGAPSDLSPSASNLLLPPNSIVEAVPLKIEFVTSAGVGVDLVVAMFGGDVTVQSCSRAVWEGY